MRSRIQDGSGTTVKAGVFDHRMRELEVQQSATNHISTSILNGRTGVFTCRSGGLNLGPSSSRSQVCISLTNHDSINKMVIDRVYVDIITSDITLPNPGITLGLSNFTGSTSFNTPFNLNENLSSKIIPVIVPKGNIAFIGTAANLPIKIFPIVGETFDLIPPGSDSIIINGTGITPVDGTSNKNSIGIALQNQSGVLINIFLEAFIKFMMVPPDQLG